MAATLMGTALADRDAACDMPRIPTPAFPVYSTTLRVTFDANGDAAVNFDAERDTLFIGMSASQLSGLVPQFLINTEYCNTKLLVRSHATQWLKCCDRKPIFLQGVRENKRLEFRLTGGTPDDVAQITLHGFQGNGCCS